MKKNRILLLAFSLFTFNLNAQQALWSNYQFSYLSINPAFTGERGYLGVNGILGNQLTGNIRPQAVSQIVIADSPLGNGLKHNIGFQGYNSNLGNINNVGLNLSYAYRYITDSYKLSFGTLAGFMVQPNSIINNAVNLLLPYAGFGALASTENYFLSVSNPYFLADAERIVAGKQPWFFMGGASLGDPNKVMLNVSSLVEINKQQSSGNGIDGNLKLWLNRRAGLGVSYRLNGTNGFESLKSKAIYSFEYQFSTSMRLGLSFDSNPLQGIRVNQNVVQTPSIFQLLIHYRPVPNGQKMSNFDYF